MCDYDGESPDFCRVTMPVARKEHRCCACAETIAPGSRYRRTTGIWDGDLASFCQCARCAVMWLAICDASPDECVLLTLDCGTPWEDAIEQPAPGHLAFLTEEEAQQLLAEAA